MPRVADVVVVGGGVIGLSIGWRAARAGAAVAVVDPAPGSGASSVAAGMLAPITEAHRGEDDLLRLNRASAERWPGFAAELEEASGRTVGLRREGTVVVAFDADDRAVLDDIADHLAEHGLPHHRLTSRETRRQEPALDPGVRAGLLVEGDHQVEAALVVEALLVAAERASVELHRQRAAMVHDGERVTGVRLADGTELACDRVVLAAGCWSGQDLGLPEDAVPPVRPVKGQILTFAGPPLLDRTVRGLVRGSSLYLVPRADGRVVVGATVEEKGFDTQVTAGGLHELLRDATRLVPGIDDLALVDARAGLRPGTPDNAPVIGAAPNLGGLVLATGHFRNGILLAPVTADAVTALITGGDQHEVVASFGPDRFRVGARA